MPLVELKGVKSYQSKSGKWYHYHRATKVRIMADEGSAAFINEVERLDAKVAKKATTGTLAAAIRAYKTSSFFTDRAAATKVSYERVFKIMEEDAESISLRSLTTAEIVETQEVVLENHGRWMANYYVTVLAVVLKYARRRGWITENPAKDIERIGRDKNRKRANRPWSAAECRTVLDAAPPYLAVPIALAMLAGFRKHDVLSVQWSAIQDGQIVHATSKRDVDVAFPIHPTLANALARAPEHKAKTIAANSFGRTWTESGFNSTFCKLIRRLEKDGKVGLGLTMHGLRHTVGTRLTEAGADNDMVQRMLGQQSPAMARHYSRTADVSEQATALVRKMKVVGDRQ